jgi:hypothetical protein
MRVRLSWIGYRALYPRLKGIGSKLYTLILSTHAPVMSISAEFTGSL